MRRLLIASTLFLAGCATRPQQPPAPAQPAQPAPVEPRATRLTGLSASELVSHFGKPAFQVQEGRSLKLQFRSKFCVLDAYLYPGQSGVLVVTHVDTRTPLGADTDQATCISALEYPS